MAGSQSDPTVRVRTDERVSVRRIGRLCARIGLLAGVPSLAVVLAGIPILAASSGPATVDGMVGLLGAPAATLSGVELAVHVGALGLLVGCWFLGAGLLIDGLFDDRG